ncbi:Pesticin receptor [Thalassocella blandensis]|nr:Pesticin receptor [Thalassocella blandensis]
MHKIFVIRLKKQFPLSLHLFSLSITIFCLAVNATAQPAKKKSSVVEEMIVTAQKREQSMQDVSIAVSAFSGDAMEKMGFEEGLDITQQVPNMNFFAIFGEASSPSISLRGISLVNFSDSWESPVSLYVDDVYRGNPAGSAIQLFDLQRVEVLRGPQGTLYGRNTTGGLVHYVSKKPSDSLEAYANISAGSYNELVLDGAVGGPVTDGIRVRFATKRVTNDGWQTNTNADEINAAKAPGEAHISDTLNDTDSIGVRAQVEFDLGVDGRLLLKGHYSDADQHSVGFAHMGYLESAEDGAATCSIARIQRGECTSQTFDMTGVEAVEGHFDPEHAATSAPGGLVTKIETSGFSAKLNWQFANELHFTSITAIENLEKFLQDDGDGTPVVWFDEQYSVDAEQFTQELRLDGMRGSTSWVTGLYFYDDARDLITQAPTNPAGQPWEVPASYGDPDFSMADVWHHEDVRLETQSWALFGQIEHPIADQWTLVMGLRYTEEKRDFYQDAGPSFYSDIDVERDLSEEASTGRLGLEWRPNADTLVYTNYATGFKSGGFSGSYNASLLATEAVDAETIDNVEAGIKTSFNGGYRLNAAVFHYTVEGYQAQVFMTVADGSVITNAGDVTGTGAEIELTAPITTNFEVIAGAGLLNTEFDSDQEFIVAGDTYTLDGNELPSSPGLTYNLVARYYIGLGQKGELVLQGDYAWQDEHYLQIENDPYSHHDAYGITNAKISWQSQSGRWNIAAFAKNLSDEEYFTYQNTLGADWGYAVWGKPRTVGLGLTWKL